MRSGLPTRLLLVALAAPGLPACTGGHAARSPGDPPAARPSELAVRRGDFVATLPLTGRLRAVHAEEVLVPRLPNWSAQIRWLETDGARVAAGQKVAELDSAALVSDLEERRVERDRAVSELAQREAAIASEIADRELQAEKRRIELEKARLEASVPPELLPARQWQERQLAVLRAETALAKALEDLEAFRVSSAEELRQKRIAIEKAEREIEAAENALGVAVLRAPKAGILVVGEHPWEGRKLQVGDNVWPGISLAQIPSLEKMQVEAYLADVDDGEIAAGMPAVCTLDAYPDLSFPGRVLEITPIAQEAEWRSLRRSFRATVALDRSDPERMRPGMSVRVEVETARRAGVLLVPREGLDLSREPPLALLLDGGTAEVRLGRCNARECVLEGGLEAGARLRRSAAREG